MSKAMSVIAALFAAECLVREGMLAPESEEEAGAILADLEKKFELFFADFQNYVQTERALESVVQCSSKSKLN